jgi:hypothetical protein
VVEDLPLELLQPRSWIEAELVREQGPDALVGRQRVGLAPGAVQRGDQQLPESLPVGVHRHRRFQLADHVVAELQPGRKPGLGELRARLLELRPVGGGPVAGRRQHVTSIARQRSRAQLGRAAVVGGGE